MEQRKAHRVVFERGSAANMMAIDGTWQRPCTTQDVSETGARDRSLAELERRTAPREVLRLVQSRGLGRALPTLFVVHAYVDDHVLEATAKTAKAAFAKAIEWHVVGRLTDVAISNGRRVYSITEFASAMALAEIANIEASAE